MATNLFEDFNPISSKQWKQKIQFELDGADYNQTVIWNSPEDIQVKPFYHDDEFYPKRYCTNSSVQISKSAKIFLFLISRNR